LVPLRDWNHYVLEIMEISMANFQAFLAFARFFGRIPANAWDAIIPHGPSVARRHSAPFDDFSAVALNPQPLPPREFVALAVADAHLSEIVRLASVGESGGDRSSALRLIAEIDDICPPNWPWPPKGRFPPPPPPWWEIDEPMRASELFFMGGRFLLAGETVADPAVRQALTRTGLNMMEAGVKDIPSEPAPAAG
jgi:hypothetical protein